MIFPISHEECTVRRWPWVTIAIGLVNAVVFAIAYAQLESDELRRADAERTAAAYHAAHPYLSASKDLRAVVLPHPGAPPRREADQALGRLRAKIRGDEAGAEARDRRPDPLWLERLPREQRILDDLVGKVRRARENRLVSRYGYVPARRNPPGLLTAQFLHDRWLDLVINLWFLWLAGCTLEERWGRVVFTLFYVAAGSVSLLTCQLFNPESEIVVLGSSGAIAGTVGALLVRFAKTRIRFVALLVRPRTFLAPAYVVLPLWVLAEALDGSVSASGSSLAYGASLGGLVFGALWALGARAASLEKWVRRGSPARVVRQEDPAVRVAAHLIDEGRPGEALLALDQLASTRHNDVDVWVEMLRAAHAVQSVDQQARAYVELIAIHLRENSEDVAVKLYREMVDRGLELSLSAALRLKVARRLERQGSWPAAAHEYQKLHSGALDDETAFQALLAHASLSVRQHRKREALELYDRARQAVSSHLELEAAVAQGLRTAHALPDDGPEIRQAVGSMAPRASLDPARLPSTPARRRVAAAAPTLMSSHAPPGPSASAGPDQPGGIPPSSTRSPRPVREALSLTPPDFAVIPGPESLGLAGPSATEGPGHQSPRVSNHEPHTFGWDGLAGLMGSRADETDTPHPLNARSDLERPQAPSTDGARAAGRAEEAGRYSLTPRSGEARVTKTTEEPGFAPTQASAAPAGPSARAAGQRDASPGAGRYSLSSKPTPGSKPPDGVDPASLRRSRPPLFVETVSLDRPSRRPLPSPREVSHGDANPEGAGKATEEQRHGGTRDPRRD